MVAPDPTGVFVQQHVFLGLRRAAAAAAVIAAAVAALMAAPASAAPARPAGHSAAGFRAACPAAPAGRVRCLTLYRPAARPRGLSPQAIESAYRLPVSRRTG
jgi:hypothetical protein